MTREYRFSHSPPFSFFEDNNLLNSRNNENGGSPAADTDGGEDIVTLRDEVGYVRMQPA